MSINNEDQLTAACFRWHWDNYPDQRRLLLHVPNGGTRSKIEASKLKSMGVTPGVADFIYLATGKAIFIELKFESGTQRSSQKKWQELVESLNYEYFLVTSFENFKYLIQCLNRQL
jgi:hypothetical protein